MVDYFLFRIISFFDFCPIYYGPKILKIFGSSIAIVYIICMFPYITREEWYIFCCKRSLCIGSWSDLKWSICFLNEPSPSRTKCCKSYLIEFWLKILYTSPLLLKSSSKITKMKYIKYWSKWIKVERMIPYLSCIIKYSSRRFFDYFFKIHIFKFCSCNKFIEIIYIGLMMLSRMELESFRGNIWSKCIDCIWKWWASKHNIFIKKLWEYTYFIKISNLYENLFHYNE